MSALGPEKRPDCVSAGFRRIQQNQHAAPGHVETRREGYATKMPLPSIRRFGDICD